jgi:DNA-binding PadR family transcriptional regulator
MHGYQLMHAIADRTGGRWAPSPGAVYPTISQMEDEGLVDVVAGSGRKLVSLTPAGEEYVAEHRDSWPDPFATPDAEGESVDLRAAVGGVVDAVRQVGRSGTDEQRAAAAAALAETRRTLYLILAGDPVAAPAVAGVPDPAPQGAGLLVSTASVATPAAARYAKQLASHLGRRCEVRETDEGTLLVMDAGECLLDPTEESLELRATAPTDEALETVQDVVARHLERFGQREELVVAWAQRS